MPGTSKLVIKLNTINKPAIAPLCTGHSETIADFYNDFIAHHMFNRNTVLAIHRALIEYVKKPNAVFAIRSYFSAPKHELYHTLRRGWLTRTTSGYSFFYTDNFYAAYYAKFAHDDFTFTAEELLETHLQRQFPSRFGLWTNEEKEKRAVSAGKNPGFNIGGYKLAHIFATAEDDYCHNGTKQSLKQIVDKYFNRGERFDYQPNADGVCVRDNFDTPTIAKDFLIAQFLRFVDPLNYIILPQKKYENFGGRGIAEHKPLLAFVQSKMQEIYGDEYTEFLKLIMAPETNTAPSGNSKIDLIYGLTTPKTTHPRPVITKSRDTETLKIGERVKLQLIPALQSNKITDTDIRNLMDAKYCKQALGINFPLLSHERIVNGRPRYYATQINIRGTNYYICQEWYKTSHDLLTLWLEKFSE